MSDTELHYPFADPPAAASTIEVAPGVLWLRMPMPFPPGHINLWLIADGEGWALVDTGLATDVTRELWQSLLRRYKLTRLICTHFHHDHAGLAGWLCEGQGVGLAMPEAEYYALQDTWARTLAGIHRDDERDFFTAAGLPPATLSLAVASFHDGNFVSPPPATFTPLSDGDELAIGSQRWRVMTSGGHSPEHALLYCAELGVLIAGDQLLPRITPSVGLNLSNRLGDPLACWMAAMLALQNLPAATLVLPSHQLPFIGAGQRAARIAAYHHRQLARLAKALTAAPASAYGLSQSLFTRLSNPVAELMAVSETLAHLRHLQLCRQAACYPGADGIIYWQAATQPASLLQGS
ncbi:MBL fold metallo-hydrolase [Aquitalea sp. S1-19]|nr:MBL fold metallo-hydrolase [Aquitalea sp. S1-19]